MAIGLTRNCDRVPCRIGPADPAARDIILIARAREGSFRVQCSSLLLSGFVVGRPHRRPLVSNLVEHGGEDRGIERFRQHAGAAALRMRLELRVGERGDEDHPLRRTVALELGHELRPEDQGHANIADDDVVGLAEAALETDEAVVHPVRRVAELAQHLAEVAAERGDVVEDQDGQSGATPLQRR